MKVKVIFLVLLFVILFCFIAETKELNYKEFLDKKIKLNSKINAKVESLKTFKSLLDYANEKNGDSFQDEVLLLHVNGFICNGESTKALDILDILIDKYKVSKYTYVNIRHTDFSYENEDALHRQNLLLHLENYPDNTCDIALLIKAQILCRLEKANDAINILKEYINTYPKGRWVQCDRHITSEVIQYSKWFRCEEQIFLLISKLYMEQKLFKEAINVLRMALKIYDLRFSQLLFFDMLSNCYEKTGDIELEKITLKNLLQLHNQFSVKDIYFTYVNGRLFANKWDGKYPVLHHYPDVIEYLRPQSELIHRIKVLEK